MLSQETKIQAVEENLGKEPEGEVNKKSSTDDNEKVVEANVEAVADSEANL